MRNSFKIITGLAIVHLLYFSVGAQQYTVTGRVLGAYRPLQGATILVDKISKVTNAEGKFSVALDSGKHFFHITHAGYERIIEEIKIHSSTSIDFVMSVKTELDEVTVLGSRFSSQRGSYSSLVPVDIISSKQLLQTGQTNPTQMLQFAVPSVNASRQLVHEPITLRGLDPDQVLILVNGKRYHNMSFINFGGVRGVLGRGAVANDLNAIPFSSIEKIEVLRDGASAQYGSDAIAGVINIQLKKSADKTSAQLHTGQFYKGDGENISFGINHGVTFLKNGFLNFAGAYRFQNPTYRGGKYEGSVYANNLILDDSIIKARNFNRNEKSNAGSSKHQGYSLSVNGAYSVDTKTNLFWTAIFNHRTTVFTSGYVFPKNLNRINPELFPDGFQSKPINHTKDVTLIGGARGEIKDHWRWELSSTYGINSGKYYNRETNNASQYFVLGKNAPTSFYTGSLLYGQLVNNVQFAKTFYRKTNKILNLAIGAEWRWEHYKIKEGEEASWETYGNSGGKLGGSGGLVLSPKDAVNTSRHVAATYLEMEYEFEKRLLINAATRLEHYSDFGGSLAGKIAARYKVNSKFFVRGSASNGFRAPSLQQQFYSQTRTSPSIVAGTYSFVTNGIIRNNSNVAMALGISSLKPEKSLSLSGGLDVNVHSNISFTIDGYWLQIKNRLVLSGVFDRITNSNVNDLLKDITDVNQLQFFTNAINTKTKGVDLVLNGRWPVKKATFTAMLAANFTQTKLFGDIKKAGKLKADSLNNNTLFNQEEKTKLEKGQPLSKIILSLNYKIANTTLNVRNTRFGKTEIAPMYIDPNTRRTSFLCDSFSSKVLTDISVSYSLKKLITLSIGANNIFNIYPQRLGDYRNTGEGMYIYSQEASPFGFNGGYYFVSAEINF